MKFTPGVYLQHFESRSPRVVAGEEALKVIRLAERAGALPTVGITTNFDLYLSCPWMSTGFFIKNSYSCY